MNLALVCVIFVISETNSFYVDDSSFHKDVEEKGVLLRKLQNLQEHDSRNATQTTSWSEILADILVKRVFSFHKPNNEGHITNVEDDKNVWVKSVSFLLKIYKKYLYDKMKHNDIRDSNNEVEEAKRNATEVNPNDDIEIIEPKYHGKLCDDCKDDTEIEINNSDCGNDSIKDADGKCSSKSSKFILSVPPQCPDGYRRDWLGYCRELL